MGSIQSALDTVRFIQKEACLGTTIYQTTSTFTDLIRCNFNRCKKLNFLTFSTSL